MKFGGQTMTFTIADSMRNARRTPTRAVAAGLAAGLLAALGGLQAAPRPAQALTAVAQSATTLAVDPSRTIPGALTVSRIDFKRKDWITYAVLLLQTMPLSATMVPIYGLTRDLGLRNSYVGLILVHAAIELPFLVWLMKGFFDSIPRHLEEAAWLDGRTKIRALVEIVLPLARPGLGIAAGLSFLSAWAEVLMVIILIDQQDLKTVPLAFYEAMRTQGGYTEVQYGVIAAMGVLYLLPVMAVFFGARRLMIRGLMNSTRGL